MTEPPHIPDDIPRDVSVLENSRITIPCPARGTPSPRISWSKDGYQLGGNEIGIRILADGSLQLDRAQSSDAGQYTCFADNLAGNASKNFELHVFCKLLAYPEAVLG